MIGRMDYQHHTHALPMGGAFLVFRHGFIGPVYKGTCFYERVQPAALMINIAVVRWACKEAIVYSGIKQGIQRFDPFGSGCVAEEFSQPGFIGNEFADSNNVAKYWKNGKAVSLTDGK